MNISPSGSLNGDDIPPTNETMAGNERPAKRVRTGCLTCRGRHLKCDEVYPICTQCRKGSRPCVRGMRVRFYEPVICNLEDEVRVDGQLDFRDESVSIASEYVGGLERYGFSEAHRPRHSPTPPSYGNSVRHPSTDKARSHTLGRSVDLGNGYHQSPTENQPSLPSIHGMLPNPFEKDTPATFLGAGADSNYFRQLDYPDPSPRYSRTPESANAIANADEALFMQVFIEEMGCWMDSMNSVKYFSHILPYESLEKPMLYNAFLACGARHLRLVNQNYGDDMPRHYYDLATQLLTAELKYQTNRELCAMTAVVLNVYEVMSFSSVQRMDHIRGSRILIQGCGWNAASDGVAAACFWLHVGMELLSCLHFNWPLAWNPDEWGLDLKLPSAPETRSGMETLWTHRIVYIVTKITNLRANSDQQDIQARYSEWTKLKRLIDDWEHKIPRTMRPMLYLQPGQNTKSPSNFPQIWLPERTAVLARIFYHTGMIVLSNTHPYGFSSSVPSSTMLEMEELRQKHAHILCGIVRQVTDRGIASIAIRSSAIAAECLTDRAEQDEILDMLRSFKEQTGWRIDFIQKELKRKWNRQNEMSPPETAVSQQIAQSRSPQINPQGTYHLQASQTHLQQPPSSHVQQQTPPQQQQQQQQQHHSQSGMTNTNQSSAHFPTYSSQPQAQQQQQSQPQPQLQQQHQHQQSQNQSSQSQPQLQQHQQRQQNHLPHMQGSHHSNQAMPPMSLPPKGPIPSLSTSRQSPRNSLGPPAADYHQIQPQYSHSGYGPPPHTQPPVLGISGSSSMAQQTGASHHHQQHGPHSSGLTSNTQSMAAHHSQFGQY